MSRRKDFFFTQEVGIIKQNLSGAAQHSGRKLCTNLQLESSRSTVWAGLLCSWPDRDDLPQGKQCSEKWYYIQNY